MHKKPPSHSLSKENRELLLIKKSRSDKISKIVIFCFSTFSIIALIFIASFVLAQAMPAIKNKGFFEIFFRADFDPSQNKFGVWGPLSITIVTAVFAVIIGLYISIRLAIFIFYRLKKTQKIVRFSVELLATIPSVIFGLFAAASLGNFIKLITGANTSQTIATAIVMLTIMIIPTMTSMIINQLKNVDPNLLKNSLALGNTQTYSIYHVVKREIRSGIIVSAVVALGRVIGETMAVSMLLTGATDNPFSEGLGHFFNAQWNTLGGNIAYWMVSDAAGIPYLKNALYAAGIMLFVLIITINIIIINFSRRKKIETSSYQFTFQLSRLNNFQGYFFFAWFIIKYPFMLIRFSFNTCWKYLRIGYDFLIYHTVRISAVTFKLKGANLTNNQKYFYKQSNSGRKFIFDYIRLGLEMFFAAIVLSSVFWIISTLFIDGLGTFSWGHVFTTQRDSLGSSIVVTILVIVVTIIVAFPFAFAGAIYLSEYASKKSRFPKILRFFLDSLGGTPSIIFGMFGLFFFLQTLHISAGSLWKSGSVLAGSLTMAIVILPSMTRVMEQAFTSVPQSLRLGSYALGATKWETIRKVVIPAGMNGIVSAFILSIGRVVSETAPIYLTVGILPHKPGLLFPGQTLTSRILYYFLYSPFSPDKAKGLAYEAGIATFVLVLTITFVAMYWKNLVHWWKQGWNFLKEQLFTKKQEVTA